MASFAYLNQESAIDKAKTDLEQFFQSKSIEEKDIARLLIVVDEIVSNIVFYSEVKNGVFTINADFKDNEVSLVFKDNGKKFNPLEQDDPNIKKPIIQRDVGGLGILIVKKMADTLTYEYKEECNILTFKKLFKYN